MEYAKRNPRAGSADHSATGRVNERKAGGSPVSSWVKKQLDRPDHVTWLWALSSLSSIPGLVSSTLVGECAQPD